MARKSYLAVNWDWNQSEFHDMVHTENFFSWHQKKSSGLYDGTNKEDMKRLIEDPF
jgi:protein SCO1/2